MGPVDAAAVVNLLQPPRPPLGVLRIPRAIHSHPKAAKIEDPGDLVTSRLGNRPVDAKKPQARSSLSLDKPRAEVLLEVRLLDEEPQLGRLLEDNVS
jgi:hypothetical protein